MRLRLGTFGVRGTFGEICVMCLRRGLVNERKHEEQTSQELLKWNWTERLCMRQWTNKGHGLATSLPTENYNMKTTYLHTD